MLRWLLLVCGALLVCALDVQSVFAQSTTPWPSYPLPDAPQAFPRGTGFYLSIWKILAFWMVRVRVLPALRRRKRTRPAVA